MKWKNGIKRIANEAWFRYVFADRQIGKTTVDKFPHTERGIRRTSYPLVPPCTWKHVNTQKKTLMAKEVDSNTLCKQKNRVCGR